MDKKILKLGKFSLQTVHLWKRRSITYSLTPIGKEHRENYTFVSDQGVRKELKGFAVSLKGGKTMSEKIFLVN